MGHDVHAKGKEIRFISEAYGMVGTCTLANNVRWSTFMVEICTIRYASESSIA